MSIKFNMKIVLQNTCTCIILISDWYDFSHVSCLTLSDSWTDSHLSTSHLQVYLTVMVNGDETTFNQMMKVIWKSSVSVLTHLSLSLFLSVSLWPPPSLNYNYLYNLVEACKFSLLSISKSYEETVIFSIYANFTTTTMRSDVRP